MKQSISFKLNNQSVTVNVNGEESLLTVIREYLNKTGTKYGCGLGDCGACTVLVDSDPIRSCMILIEDVAGKEILTIEGLLKSKVLWESSQLIDSTLNPTSGDFLDCQSLVGYCQPIAHYYINLHRLL